MSIALAAVAVVVALAYHLPLRDPDGVVVPTYVRLPVILLAAFLTDVVPRALWRGGALRRRAGAAPAGGGGRWAWGDTPLAVVGLGAWGLTYAPVRDLKSVGALL